MTQQQVVLKQRQQVRLARAHQSPQRSSSCRWLYFPVRHAVSTERALILSHRVSEPCCCVNRLHNECSLTCVCRPNTHRNGPPACIKAPPRHPAGRLSHNKHLPAGGHVGGAEAMTPTAGCSVSVFSMLLCSSIIRSLLHNSSFFHRCCVMPTDRRRAARRWFPVQGHWNPVPDVLLFGPLQPLRCQSFCRTTIVPST